MRWVVALVLTVGFVTRARADVAPEDARRAAELFDQGRRAFASRAIDAACDAFAESLSIDPQLGTRLNLAACRAEQGKLVEAHALFTAAQAEAEQSGKPARASYAKEQLAALEARLVRLNLIVSATPDLTVTVNGRAIDPATRQLLPPGQVSVDVTAPGRRPVHIAKLATAGSEITIDVPALEPDGASVEAAATEPRRRTIEPPVALTTRPRTPYLVAGAGVLLGLAAGGLTLHARARWADATTARDRDGVSSAQHEADAATVLAIGGAAAVATGVLLWVRGRHEVGDSVSVVPTRSGLALRGAF